MDSHHSLKYCIFDSRWSQLLTMLLFIFMKLEFLRSKLNLFKMRIKAFLKFSSLQIKSWFNLSLRKHFISKVTAYAFNYHFPLQRGMALHLIRLSSHHPRMNCSKFAWCKILYISIYVNETYMAALWLWISLLKSTTCWAQKYTASAQALFCSCTQRL